MIHGIINVYKEKGFTSFDVVAKSRGIFKQKKIGHTGTLDPDAEGVLPLCFGKATKVCDLLTEKNKEYKAVMLLGKVTDTQDISGTVLEEHEVTVSKEEVRMAVMSFLGDIMQVPPMYSALKVNGQKLCDLAREGKTVERKARPVTIHEIEILEMELPRVTMRVKCSKGTYIRTLCEDIGAKLGCGACMESLLRTKVSSFNIEDALKLSELEALVQECTKDIPPTEWNAKMFSFVHSVDSVFLKYPMAVVTKEHNKLLYNGNRVVSAMLKEETDACRIQPVRIYDEEGHFIGIYEYDENREDYKPVKLFLEE
ncbi:MAG: tRNA pseudouridine(55) synthase TruB [Roseburia sp.]|nr:tRNA pseudouridine(55) synthase TruB [Roseburia sp.]